MLRKEENANPLPEIVESKDEWYQQKVLLKNFPMNGHVKMFR
jgi:hypothetical protein